VTRPSSDLERRSALELRAVGDRLVGHCIVFDSRSCDMGGFVEVVRPQAVTRSLSADVVALYDHQPGSILGRTPATLQLRTDDRGLAFTITPPDTQVGRDVLTLVGRGDLTGASFGFRTLKDAWSTDHGTTIRELLDIEIAEISLTAFPAYQQTDAAIAQRSLQAYQAQQGKRIDWLRRRHTARGL
jgi:HK97 family phage prohead protease